MSTDAKPQMSTDKKYLYEDLTYKIIGCLYDVHKELGNVHKEIVYHRAIAIELGMRKIPFIEEVAIDVMYKGEKIGLYRPDFVINGQVVLEIKAVPIITKSMQNQVYYYIKGTPYKLVLLANFGAVRLGIKRLIYL